MKQRGFTLVELLVVIAIIAVLATMAVQVGMRQIAKAGEVKCASNMRQIGTALLLYAADNDGRLPPTTHTTGSGSRLQQSWIYGVEPYLDRIDEIRVCPAEERHRREAIRRAKGTSYVLNDIVFDPEEDEPAYNRLPRLPVPSRTALMFILSADRPIGRTRDHAHCREWKSWGAVLSDVEADRHRSGTRAADRLRGSTNILYADGHVENVAARELKKRVDAGENPGAVPEKL